MLGLRLTTKFDWNFLNRGGVLNIMVSWFAISETAAVRDSFTSQLIAKEIVYGLSIYANVDDLE